MSDETPEKFVLTEPEVAAVRSLIAEIAPACGSVDDPGFLSDAAVLAHEMPRRLRRFLNDFRFAEAPPAFRVVSGYPVDGARIGRTPEHWRRNGGPSPALEEEIYLVLLGSLIADPIGWATQQDGRVVHDVCPVRGYESEQIGVGCEQPIWWHTEDAFHPFHGDYIGLLCLRNPDRVATTVATVTLDGMAPSLVDRLFEAHYAVRPDESHQPENNTADGNLADSFRLIEKMNAEPEKMAVLFGSREAPFARLDPYFMQPVEEPREAQAALEALSARIEASLAEQVLEPGDVCLIDNLRAVHGRRPFKARHDGNDRWLKRINLARDLRKSRGLRASSASRVIG